MEANLTRCDRFIQNSTVTCTSRGLTARMTYLSNCRSTVLLACTRVSSPSIQRVLLISLILTCSQIAEASQVTNINLYISFLLNQIQCFKIPHGVIQYPPTCEKSTPSPLRPFFVNTKNPRPWQSPTFCHPFSHSSLGRGLSANVANKEVLHLALLSLNDWAELTHMVVPVGL